MQDSVIPDKEWEIAAQFTNALVTIENLLEKRLKPSKLKMFLCQFCHPLNPEILYVESHLYEHASTTTEIITSLVPKFINYVNVGLLKQIVEIFGCKRCKAALQKYLKLYSQFTCKKLCNMPNAVSDEELDQATGVKKLRVETDKKLEEATITDVETVQNGLGKSTGIDPSFIAPAQHDEGSLILTFLVPESVWEIFHELCEEDLEILADCEVMRLQIEDCVIENIQQYRTKGAREIEQSSCFDHPGITAKGIDIALLLQKKVLRHKEYAHLVDLLADIPQEDMHKECTDRFLWHLAPNLDNWIELTPYLGIPESVVLQITGQHPDSINDQTYQALLQWKQLDCKSATYECLVECLVRHASLSAIKAALSMISPANLGKISKVCTIFWV